MNSKTLDIVRHSTEVAVTNEMVRHLANPVGVQVFRNLMHDSLVVRLTATVAADTLVEETIRYPATWRDAVRERFAPKWVLSRWPVVYRTHHFSAKALYPTMQTMGDHRPIMWSRLEDGIESGPPPF